MPDHTPSTATTGFFQTKPIIHNAYRDDKPVQRALALFLPQQVSAKVLPKLHRWGDIVLSPQVQEWIANGEANLPVLQLRDTYGKPANKLIISEGYRQLQNLGLQEGIVAAGYESEHGIHTRVVQFFHLWAWSPSSSTVTCPSAMHDGAAALLRAHLSKDQTLSAEARAVLHSAYDHLTSRKMGYAWTSGQWMTERTGGSDVRGTETRARRTSSDDLHQQRDFVASDGQALGPWAIDGFKWFSSATDADMTILLAKTPGNDNLSCFFAPTRIRKRNAPGDTALGPDARANTEFNGIYPQRLKNKLGTKSMPTAELELRNMRGYMLGQEGQGVKEISTVLTLTRLHNAISAVGYFARALAVSRAYARVRRVGGGQLLAHIPAHVKTMALWHVEYRANLLLSLFLSHCLGVTESAADAFQPDRILASRTQAQKLLRLFTPVAKALTALTSVAGIRACMESLGGIGYLENEDVELNLARIFRDANVLPIWEGTTNIMAGDVVRVLTGRDGAVVIDTLREWTRNIAASSVISLDVVLRETEALCASIAQSARSSIVYHAAESMERLGWIIMACLLVSDASRDQDPTAIEVARRWLAKVDDQTAKELAGRSWEKSACADAGIVFDGDRGHSDRSSNL